MVSEGGPTNFDNGTNLTQRVLEIKIGRSKSKEQYMQNIQCM